MEDQNAQGQEIMVKLRNHSIATEGENIVDWLVSDFDWKGQCLLCVYLFFVAAVDSSSMFGSVHNGGLASKFAGLSHNYNTMNAHT